MNDLVIYINWEYFLGILGALIGIAYYTSGRFSKLETSVEWLTETTRELLLRVENVNQKVFRNSSPVKLTLAGERLLRTSGLKSYIDMRAVGWLDRAHSPNRDSHHLQSWAFRLLANIRFESEFDADFGDFAFTNGLSTDLLRRVGGIYLWDIATGSQ